jgi:FkbM family methyltransferase
MNYEIHLPPHIKILAGANFPGSTTIGYALSKLTPCVADISIAHAERNLSFKFPVRTRANFRLLRGSYINGRYELGVPYEYGLIKYLCKTLCEGDTFLDIGANAGWFTLIASKLVGPSGMVISFEPNPTNFQNLCRNVYGLNGVVNAVLLPLALSDKRSTVFLDRPKMDDGTGFFMSSHGEQAIQAVRGEELLSRFNAQRIHAKIDVEAAEFLVVTGLGEELKRIRSMMVEVSPQSEERFGVTIRQLFSYMQQAGFSAATLNPDGTTSGIDSPRHGDIIFRRD